jgi:hypothetical protein
LGLLDVGEAEPHVRLSKGGISRQRLLQMRLRIPNIVLPQRFFCLLKLPLRFLGNHELGDWYATARAALPGKITAGKMKNHVGSKGLG